MASALSRAQARSIARSTGAPKHLIEDAASEAILAKLQGRAAEWGIIDFLRKNGRSRGALPESGYNPPKLVGIEEAGQVPDRRQGFEERALRHLYVEMNWTMAEIARAARHSVRWVEDRMDAYGIARRKRGPRPAWTCFCGKPSYKVWDNGTWSGTRCWFHYHLAKAEAMRGKKSGQFQQAVAS